MKTIKLYTVFLISFFFLLLSRIAVLTGNYTIPIDPRLIEILYIILILALILFDGQWKISNKVLKPDMIIVLMFIHCILWGVVFVNEPFKEYISTQFSSQIMFCIIILITALALKYFRVYNEFIVMSLYAMGLSLTIQLARNFSELNLSNVVHIFSLSERQRANFGFGHYNTLGSACLCVLILTAFIYEKNRKINIINLLFFIEAILMMLCSASRGALTGTVIFIMVLVTQKIYDMGLSKKAILGIHLFEVVLVVVMILYAMGLDMNSLLKQAQRLHLFKVAIPEYLASGRILTGVGYASNIQYGKGIMFGRILWLDNAYIYYLIATGVLGVAIIIACLLVIGIPAFKYRHVEGKIVFALFCTYLYRAIFEVNLFESGYMMNYIYLPIFIAFVYRKRARVMER